MNDEEFLNYCDTHAQTPRCAFVPEQIARLLRLSGGDAEAVRFWEEQQSRVVECNRQAVQNAVNKARERLAQAENAASGGTL